MDQLSQQWNFFEKLMFRFVFLALALFILVFNNGAYPLMYFVMKYPIDLLHIFIPWLGKNWLQLPYEITEFTNGSGDTTYDYVLLLCVGTLAVVGTLVWSFVDTKQSNYNRLFYWITVAVRFYLGFMLINYGLVKVIQLQFPKPSFYRLLTTYGESSPMGLAWTFLGFSKGYNLFMGIAELMAGLLFFRRTVTIGAIITLMTTANVMAVNYFYDVPVKIVSTALFVMCLFLLLPNIYRLFNFFFKGELVALRMLAAPFILKKWQRVTKYTLKYLVIIFTLATGFYQVWAMRSYRGNGPKSPLYGVYEVEHFESNGKTILSNDQNDSLWKVLIFEGLNTGAIKLNSGDFHKYNEIKVDTVKKIISFGVKDDPKLIAQQLNYSFTEYGHLLIQGKFDFDSIKVDLKKKKFELIERKLNWINERPYNK